MNSEAFIQWALDDARSVEAGLGKSRRPEAVIT